MLLKVTVGDKFNIRANAWWTGSSSGSNTSPLTSIVSALISSAPGLSGGKLNPADLTSTILDPQVNAFLSSQPAISGKPKAYLNWILFDEQFKYVSGSSGAEAVDASGVFKTFNKTNMPVDKNGYLYIYVSNETSYDVFFDNLQVTHVRGSLLEESHYYPWGLVMAGISSKTLSFGSPENKYKFNAGTELSNKEFSNGSGLELYETPFRGYDAQIARFHQQDLLADFLHSESAYSFSHNSPLWFNDPSGLAPDSIPKLTPSERRSHVTVTSVSKKPKAIVIINEPGYIYKKPAPDFSNIPVNAPLMQGGQLVLSAQEWADHYRGLTLNQIVTQSRPLYTDGYQRYLLGLIKFRLGPRDFRYVKLPNGKVVDMRHVLVVGMKTIAGVSVGEVLGAVGEVGQLFVDRESALSTQDFYSNSLGADFLQFLKKESIYYSSTRDAGDSQETMVSVLFLKFVNQVK